MRDRRPCLDHTGREPDLKPDPWNPAALSPRGVQPVHYSLPPMPPTVFGLAPLQGIADPFMRAHLSALGGMGWCVAGFVRVTASDLPDAYLLRFCPELRTGSLTRAGVPVQVQLLGSDAERMARTAARLVALGAGGVDLNFGCPVRRVNGHGGGAALLRNAGAIERIVAAVRKALPSRIQVSAKLRLGWDSPDAAVDIARAAESGGASWVALHGRTRTQGYDGVADWARIGLVRQHLRIPVIANGDLRTPEDIEACRRASGCDRFLVGRGAIERPETFRVLAGLDACFWSWPRRAAFVAGCAEERITVGQPPERVAGLVKGWLVAMGRVEPAARALFDAHRRAETVDELVGALRAEGACEALHASGSMPGSVATRTATATTTASMSGKEAGRWNSPS